jgi:hypothetical protein
VGDIYIESTPHAFVFDWTGKMVYNGSILKAIERTVQAVMETTPDWLAGPRKYEKVLAELKWVLARKKLGAAANSLRKKSLSADPLEKEEALELLARLTKYAADLERRATSRLDAGEPVEARGIWKRLAKVFQGDEIGDQAASAEKERAKSKPFKAEMAAFKLLQVMEKTAEKIRALRPGQKVEKWRTKYAAPLRQVEALFRKMETDYHETRVYLKAQLLLVRVPSVIARSRRSL